MRQDVFNLVFLASAAGFEHVDGSFLVQLLIILTAFATLATMVRGWFRKSPPDSEKYRHADECEKRCNANLAQHDRLEREFSERMTAMSGHSANSRKSMYERLARVENELAGIKKENELQTKELYLIRDMLARQNSQKQ